MQTLIHTKTPAEFIAVLAIFQYRYNWKWAGGGLPLKGIHWWSCYKERTYLTFKNNFDFGDLMGYGQESYIDYKQKKHKVLSFDDFIEIKDKNIHLHCENILEKNEN